MTSLPPANIEHAIVYTCGCRETWMTASPMPDGLVLRSEHTCVPEICQACAAHGRACPTRAGSYAYPLNPITWSADAPPRRYTRRKS